MATVNILLIEDEICQATKLISELQEKNNGTSFSIEHVKTSTEGLERLRSAGIDAIILDLVLPNGEGTALVEKFQAAFPLVPIIVLTGYAEHLELGSLYAGAEEFLAKDTLTILALTKAIRHAMARHKARPLFAPVKTALSSASEKIEALQKLTQQVTPTS